MIISSSPTKKSSCTTIQKIAQTRQEREAAFGLIYRSYLHAGLCKPNQLELRILPYHLTSTSEIFITVVDQEVVATVSLFVDSNMGLPMDSVFPQQINDARKNGYLMSEISCLADCRKNGRVLANLCELTRLLVQYARFQRLDGVTLLSHPKHARFYKRYMGFEAMGPIRPFPEVQNSLAEPLRFDFANIASASEELYERILGEQIPEEQLVACPMSAEDRDYFSAKLNAIQTVGEKKPITNGKYVDQISIASGSTYSITRGQ